MKEKIIFLNDILPDNLRKIFENAKYEKEILNYAKTILNQSIKNHCKPIYINNQILIIAVDNPLWANEIINYKYHLLNNINKKFNNYLKDIKTKFLPEYFIKKESKNKISESDKIFIEKQVERVSDIELKEKLSSLIKTFIIVDKK
ncbi:MAG: DUF721 domain-containing protein [Exilispira sp.]